MEGRLFFKKIECLQIDICLLKSNGDGRVLNTVGK